MSWIAGTWSSIPTWSTQRAECFPWSPLCKALLIEKSATNRALKSTGPWTWDVRRRKKLVPHLLTTIFIAANEHLVLRHFDRWVVIVPFNMEREAMNFISQIMRAASGMKINMCDPYVHKIRDDNMGNYINAIDEVLSRQLPDILICMVNNNRSDRYSAIKKKCCVERSGINLVLFI